MWHLSGVLTREEHSPWGEWRHRESRGRHGYQDGHQLRHVKDQQALAKEQDRGECSRQGKAWRGTLTPPLCKAALSGEVEGRQRQSLLGSILGDGVGGATWGQVRQPSQTGARPVSVDCTLFTGIVPKEILNNQVPTHRYFVLCTFFKLASTIFHYKFIVINNVISVCHKCWHFKIKL